MVVDIADPLRGGTSEGMDVSHQQRALQITIDSATELSVNIGNSPTISVVSTKRFS